MRRATGADDPALAETTWPMPSEGGDACDIDWVLRYGTPSRIDLMTAAELIAAYRALIADGTTTRQTQRLAALRRVHRRRMR